MVIHVIANLKSKVAKEKGASNISDSIDKYNYEKLVSYVIW